MTPTNGIVQVVQGRETGAALIYLRGRLGDGPASYAIDQNIAIAPPTAQRVPARLLDTAATWHVWSANRRAFAEAMIARPEQPRIRFVCEASSIEELRMLQRVFARVRVEAPPPEIR